MANIQKSKLKKNRKFLIFLYSFFIIIIVITPLFLTTNVTSSMDKGIYFKSKIHDIKIGDTVIAELPGDIKKFSMERGYITDKDVSILKSVVGVPGDVFEIIKKDDSFYLFKNGEEISIVIEKDSENRDLITKTKFELKNDEYFLLGNDPKVSYDSRYYGAINKKYFKFKAKLIYKFREVKK